MTSIRKIQTERVLSDVVHALYSQGTNPLLAEVLGRVSRYFANYAPGKPLPLDMRQLATGEVSNVEEFNAILEHTLLNMDVLYETSIRQVEDVMMLNNALYDDLERLKSKQKRLEGKISDYLLMNNNSEGHFLVVSDNFSDLSMTDLGLTTARVDVDTQSVGISSLGGYTRTATRENVGNPDIRVLAGDKETNYVELAPFSGAIEASADNILWAIEVDTEEPKEVLVVVTVPLRSGSDPFELSRVDFTPYSNKPTQIWMEMVLENGDVVSLGRRIQSSVLKLSMATSPEKVRAVKFYLRKTQHDYLEDSSSSTRYKYVFGARSIEIKHLTYERNAVFVSSPIVLPDDMEDNTVIDAVSLDTQAEIPGGSEITYYLASETLAEGSNEQKALSDFAWRRISPVDARGRENKVVRFDGAFSKTKMIRSVPGGSGIQLIPRQSSGPVRDRNPSPTIIDGVDIYRIAELWEEPMRNSLELIEGVNTTRITSVDIDSEVPFSQIDLSYWAEILKGDPNSMIVDYGRIDSGNEFFYGGDIGASGKEVMVEAFIECSSQFDTFLSEVQKIDSRSRTWDMKLYLNGNPLGEMERGVDTLRVPWGLRQGLNHIVLLARIPLSASESHPYMGAISLMGGDADLQSFGLVRLDKWNYVDLFTMRYNEVGQPKTFSLHENEIISRRMPTDNLQLRYATKTGLSPQAIRLRADMSRSRNTPNVSPKLDSYTLRFGYGSA